MITKIESGTPIRGGAIVRVPNSVKINKK